MTNDVCVCAVRFTFPYVLVLIIRECFEIIGLTARPAPNKRKINDTAKRVP